MEIFWSLLLFLNLICYVSSILYNRDYIFLKFLNCLLIYSCCVSLWYGGGGLAAKSCLTLAIPWTVACQAPLLWDSPGKKSGMGCHFLLQGIFPTQESNPHLSHCQWILTTEPPGKPGKVRQSQMPADSTFSSSPHFVHLTAPGSRFRLPSFSALFNTWASLLMLSPHEPLNLSSVKIKEGGDGQSSTNVT